MAAETAAAEAVAAEKAAAEQAAAEARREASIVPLRGLYRV